MRKWTVAALAAVSVVALGVGSLVPGALAQQQQLVLHCLIQIWQ